MTEYYIRADEVLRAGRIENMTWGWSSGAYSLDKFTELAADIARRDRYRNIEIFERENARSPWLHYSIEGPWEDHPDEIVEDWH